MKNIDITPEAYNDLAVIKEKLDEEFGEAQGKKDPQGYFQRPEKTCEIPGDRYKALRKIWYHNGL